MDVLPGRTARHTAEGFPEGTIGLVAERVRGRGIFQLDGIPRNDRSCRVRGADTPATWLESYRAEVTGLT